MIAWVFPGQGAQRKGMGADLFDDYPDLCATADEILGRSVRELCLDDPENLLARTRYAQPALYVVSVLSLLRLRESEPEPDVLAGHSLGEIGALHAAGCFDFATGLHLVNRRAELMARADGGAMLAVLGPTAEQVAEVLADRGLTEVEVANYNSRTQTALSGPAAPIALAAEALGGRDGTRCVPLKVSGAFHSRHMEAAAAEFAAHLRRVDFAPPRIPVLAGSSGAPYPPDGAAAVLSEQMRSPVRWYAIMRELYGRGVRHVQEVGPKGTLTSLWAQTRRELDREAGPGLPDAQVPQAPQPPSAPGREGPHTLGSAEFREDYNIRYAYAAGAMYQGIASVDMVARLGHAGLLGFFGTGGLALDDVEKAVVSLGEQLGRDGVFGMNLLRDLDDPRQEEETVRLFLRHGVRFVEVAGHLDVTEPVVWFRFTGARFGPDGVPVAARHIVAKVSRPEVAEAFLRPPPPALLDRLVAAGRLTEAEAAAAARLPVAGDVCVEADSGGHTDGGVALALMPVMTRLRDDAMRAHGFPRRIRVGASGGLGSPEAVAAAFVLGADFVLTGSVNQCSVEAGTSEQVKDLLATLDVPDTAYAPAGDMFEIGARVQVVRKGTLFAARANKLYEVYRAHRSWDEIDPGTRRTLENGVFQRDFADVWEETRNHYLATGRPEVVRRAERDPRARMALAFKWYFARSGRLAMSGDPAGRANYQIHCGPAMGAFNRTVRGGALEEWRDRHVDTIADVLMSGAASVLRYTSSSG
ncbi:ACP S-malonyltransferase [Streptomyces sp. NPDC048441]|uniref:ACP S-malonyltransferase n=1 Tax=Streptomyces sp. NPDC048441 TaxID=3365552 RepID=UPI003711D44E